MDNGSTEQQPWFVQATHAPGEWETNYSGLAKSSDDAHYNREVDAMALAARLDVSRG